MKLKSLKFGASLAILALAGSLIAAKFAAGEFKVNGNSVSTDYITQNGRVYVPVSDVAAALDMQLVKHSASSYELVAKGGADQVNGVEGKVGQTLTTSNYVFTVKDVQFTDHYTHRFNGTNVDDAEAGKTIVVFTMRVKNATPKEMGLSLSNDKTALTDDQEHGYVFYTGGYADWNPNPNVLPGAAADFALVFTVPKGTNLKDLVYELGSNRAAKTTIFRIHVDQQAPTS
jgi:hypothetical protein